jgi:hypothetical protein
MDSKLTEQLQLLYILEAILEMQVQEKFNAQTIHLEV